MNLRRNWLTLFIASIALLAITCVVLFPRINHPATIIPTADTDEYRFVNKPCWFDVPWPEDIRCGELHTAASTGEFVLPVVIIRANTIDRQPDPVIYLQGGPGGSAHLHTEGIQHWLNWRSYTALGRDLILLDPRGVGRSRPALACKKYDEFSLAVLAENTSLQQELAEGHRILKDCFEQLRVAPDAFHLSHYGTAQNAQDLRELMQLLNYKSWNLLGVSYGTRVAIAVANQSPGVRSLILDSVYPAGRGGVQSFPQVLDNALTNFFIWCLSDKACALEQPDIKVNLLRALAHLKQQPLTMTIARDNGEAPVALVVNDHRFISAVFAALYNRHAWQKIPLAITAALADDARGLMPLMKSFINNTLSEDFSSLVFMAVDCRDHPVAAEADYQRALQKFPLLSDYTRDLWRYQACHFLNANEPLVTHGQGLPAVPTLILAGELDPITPVAWAREVHQQWPESQLRILPATGHAVINSDDCIYSVLRGFLDAPQKMVQGCPR